jgi:hypothetical protein
VWKLEGEPVEDYTVKDRERYNRDEKKKKSMRAGL